MKKPHIIIAIIITFFTTTLFANEQTSAANALSHLLNNFTTLQANFSQETVDSTQHVLQTSSGMMMLMKPNHFRFETQKPTHQVVITNGHVLWIYDMDLQQATKQELQKMPINPAKILSGDVTVLLKQFNVQLIPHKHIWVFLLTPIKPMQTFQSIAIAFQDEKLHSMQIHTTLTQTTTFTFSNVVINLKLSQDLFHFAVPKGVDVLQ